MPSRVKPRTPWRLTEHLFEIAVAVELAIIATAGLFLYVIYSIMGAL